MAKQGKVWIKVLIAIIGATGMVLVKALCDGLEKSLENRK